MYNLLFNDKCVTAKVVGEKSSILVPLAKNDGRNFFESEEKRIIKIVGAAKVDILFKYGFYEVDPCDIGRDQMI